MIMIGVRIIRLLYIVPVHIVRFLQASRLGWMGGVGGGGGERFRFRRWYRFIYTRFGRRHRFVLRIPESIHLLNFNTTKPNYLTVSQLPQEKFLAGRI